MSRFYDVAWRLSTGAGIGLLCGTFPAYMAQACATRAGVIPSRSSPPDHRDPLPKVWSAETRYLIEDTVIEELYFRGVLQGAALHRIPKMILNRIKLGKGYVLESMGAKVARILIVATLFSYVHSFNDDELSKEAVRAQMVGSFVGGLCLGAIKESRLGLMGAVGGHVANNLFAHLTYPPILKV